MPTENTDMLTENTEQKNLPHDWKKSLENAIEVYLNTITPRSSICSFFGKPEYTHAHKSACNLISLKLNRIEKGLASARTVRAFTLFIALYYHAKKNNSQRLFSALNEQTPEIYREDINAIVLHFTPTKKAIFLDSDANSSENSSAPKKFEEFVAEVYTENKESPAPINNIAIELANVILELSGSNNLIKHNQTKIESMQTSQQRSQHSI
ncbi:MAG: hypothetical protein CMF49_04465 [Legionellales bacterium]|nr:hypothetical protein [Legionellales bacterium]|tara:strand:+ start:352 stop:981 length:630 start_codon:yes stop_codon:yes gene_type:complete